MLIKIFQLLYSISNLFLLNIYLGFIKLQNKKIILFYHPKEDLTSIHDFYLSKFLYKDCPYKVIFGSKNIIKNVMSSLSEKLPNYYPVDYDITQLNDFIKNNTTCCSKYCYKDYHLDIRITNKTLIKFLSKFRRMFCDIFFKIPITFY